MLRADCDCSMDPPVRETPGSCITSSRVSATPSVDQCENERMLPYFIASVRAASIIALVFCASPPLYAQWLKYPTAGVPRTRDGKVNLKAPTPRTRDGKPDFSGMWLTGNPVPCDPTKRQEFLDCGAELPISLEGINMGIGLPGGLPYQKWAADQVKKQTAENAKDDPHARCMPDTFLRLY